MTDAVTVAMAPAPDLMALDLWDGALPDLGGIRAVRVEPMRWWLIDAAANAAAIAADLGTRGAITPFGGGVVRATLTGPGWRDLLSISGVFDSGDPSFTVGKVASTVIHHVPVRIVMTGGEACEVYCPASYAAALGALWRGATRDVSWRGATQDASWRGATQKASWRGATRGG